MKVNKLNQLFEDIHYEGAYKVYDNDELVAVIRKSTYELPKNKHEVTMNSYFRHFKTSPYKLKRAFEEPTFIREIGDPDRDTKEIEIRYDFVLERVGKNDSYFSISAESEKGKENSHNFIEFIFVYNETELSPIIELFLEQYNIKKKEIQIPITTKPKVDID